MEQRNPSTRLRDLRELGTSMGIPTPPPFTTNKIDIAKMQYRVENTQPSPLPQDAKK